MQLNPVAVALLAAILLTTGFFALYEPNESVASGNETSAFAGKPLPTIFYKNHSTEIDSQDAFRSARESENRTVEPQIIVHPVEDAIRESTSRQFAPRPLTSSRRSSRSSDDDDDNDDAPADTSNQTNTTVGTDLSTNQTVNQTANPPQNETNTTITTPVNETTNNQTQTNSSQLVNETDEPEPPRTPAIEAAVSIESGFPQDQNIVLHCDAPEGARLEWDFGDGEDDEDKSTVYHTYDESGEYDVTCTAKMDGALVESTITVDITALGNVRGRNPYAALLSAEGTGDTRMFTCEDVGFTADTFTWRFSGGDYKKQIVHEVNYFEGADRSITHTFPGDGEYEVECTAVSFDERMSKAFWEEGRVCNSAQGCVTATEREDIDIEFEEDDDDARIDIDVPVLNSTGTTDTNATDTSNSTSSTVSQETNNDDDERDRDDEEDEADDEEEEDDDEDDDDGDDRRGRGNRGN